MADEENPHVARILAKCSPHSKQNGTVLRFDGAGFRRVTDVDSFRTVVGSTAGRQLAFASLCLPAAYAVAQWPALADAWWYSDDYARIISLEPPFVRGCQNGRPLEGAWMATLLIDSSPSAWLANILLRAAQAAAHLVVAIAGGTWLARILRRPSIVWVCALFLLWPLHTEAVLWRTAGSYPIGALAGVAAVRLAWPASERAARGRTAAACVLVAISALTNQTSSLIVWLLPALAVLGGARIPADRRVAALVVAHAVAAAASILVTLVPEFATARASLAFEPMDKLVLLRRMLSHLWFWRAMYPSYLLLAHALLAAAVVLSVDPSRVRVRSAVTWLLGVLALCMLPFLSILAVRENTAPLRVMYLGPWLLVAAWIVVCRQENVGSARVRAVRRWLAITGTAASLIGYVAFGRGIAREYVDLFHHEQHVLDRATAIAREHGASIVVVEGVGPGTDPNPLRHRAATLSALQVPWAVRGRVERFTPLELARPAEASAPAARSSADTDRTDFAVAFDPLTRCVQILQPRRARE